jgi:hypothetical protein
MKAKQEGTRLNFMGGGLEAMNPEKKGTNSFPLRMTATMRCQVEHLAKREGISLNQFISLAVAEKVMRMEGYALSDGPAARWDAGRMKGVRKV